MSSSVSTAVSSLFQAGTAIEFLYPRHNYQGAYSELVRRRLFIQEVCDTSERPVHPERVKEAPALRRSRFRLTGVDLDKGEERSFYDESMQDVKLFDAEWIAEGGDDSPRELPMALLCRGHLVKVLNVPDPRLAKQASFKRIDAGFEAQPISDATARALSLMRLV